jgi:predicted outer membrane lipoprotein
MPNWKWAWLLGITLCVACGSHRNASRSLTTERAFAVDRDVRAFAATVAHDITQEGPAAWRRHFSDSPAFFMASEGQLQFPDSASATSGIQSLTRIIKHIELKWGDLRVDPLTEQFAVVAAPWHEIVEDEAGKKVEESGYFTGVAESRNGRWQFRDAHWSVATPSGRIP